MRKICRTIIIINRAYKDAIEKKKNSQKKGHLGRFYHKNRQKDLLKRNALLEGIKRKAH